MKNILIVALQPQRFLAQVDFARNILKKTDDLTIYFFISNETLSCYRDIINELEFKVIYEPNNIKIQSNNLKLVDIIKDRIKNKLTKEQKIKIRKYISLVQNTKIFTNMYIKQERLFLNDLHQKYKYVIDLIKDHKIRVFLINGDRHLGYEPVFLKISQELSIPSIILYLVDFADEERIFHNYVITKKIKTNIFTSNYVKYSQMNLEYAVVRNSYYYPHAIANALKKFGVLTTNPYVMGCGKSNIICLNNIYYKKLYMKNGVLEKKIRILGDGIYDSLYSNFCEKETIKKKICNQYNLEINKKIIIVSLPQLYEHNILPWNKHLEEINFIMQNLDILNQNILVSLHPKMDKNKYNFLEQKYNCKVLNERLIEVLPIADMFVASFSSTVVWSVLCGVNTIVIDFYRFNYKMYDFLTSIQKVDNKDNLRNILFDMLNKNIDFSADWKHLSKEEVFDGNTTKRYIQLIHEVSNN